MNKVRFWVKNSRATALPQSLIPAILAFCMASQQPGFAWWLGLIGVCGVIVGHLGINLFDDYFDYRVKASGYRDELARKGFRSRIAKCHYLTSGEADVKELLVAASIFCAIALTMGVIIFIFRGMGIVYFGMIAAVLGFSYSGPPLRLSYHGLGDVVIGLMFGPLLMTGVYYSAVGYIDWSIIFISIPVGLLVANIVYAHSIMDYEPDKAVGKKTFAVLLGNKTLMLVALALILSLSYLCVVGGVIAGYLSAWYLLTLLTLPMAISLFYLMVQFVRHPERKFTPKAWMGPMPNWERIEAAELDWFMIRWLSARNLLSAFCLVLIVVCFIA